MFKLNLEQKISTSFLISGNLQVDRKYTHKNIYTKWYSVEAMSLYKLLQYYINTTHQKLHNIQYVCQYTISLYTDSRLLNINLYVQPQTHTHNKIDIHTQHTTEDY